MMTKNTWLFELFYQAHNLHVDYQAYTQTKQMLPNYNFHMDNYMCCIEPMVLGMVYLS